MNEKPQRYANFNRVDVSGYHGLHTNYKIALFTHGLFAKCDVRYFTCIYIQVPFKMLQHCIEASNSWHSVVLFQPSYHAHHVTHVYNTNTVNKMCVRSIVSLKRVFFFFVKLKYFRISLHFTIYEIVLFHHRFQYLNKRRANFAIHVG